MKFRIYIYIFIGILLFNSLPYISGPIFLKSFFNYSGLFLFFIWIGCVYLFFAVLLGFIITRIFKKLKFLKKFFILILFSTIVFFSSCTFLPYLFKEINCPKEIKNASRLIESINKFHKNTGNYSDNLDELVPNYIDKIIYPKTLNIERFIYIKEDDKFNLYFIQTIEPGLEIERVVYSPSREKILGKIMYEPKDTGFKNWYSIKED